MLMPSPGGGPTAHGGLGGRWTFFRSPAIFREGLGVGVRIYYTNQLR
jgi:hypothetical protein